MKFDTWERVRATGGEGEGEVFILTKRVFFFFATADSHEAGCDACDERVTTALASPKSMRWERAVAVTQY
jgi:hypothetical protein